LFHARVAPFLLETATAVDVVAVGQKSGSFSPSRPLLAPTAAATAAAAAPTEMVVAYAVAPLGMECLGVSTIKKVKR
jgi:hypothetical protein